MARERVGPRVLARLPRRVDLPRGRFGLEVGSAGRLALRGHDLTALTRQFGSPLHVVDAAAVRERAVEAIAPLRSGDRPACDVFYSYKTHPVPGVLRLLHDEGIGAEVISAYELWLAMRLGVPAERIIYNGPVKSADSIRIAIEAGVLAINANTVDDARRIASLASETATPVSLGLRVALPGVWGGQFGLAPDANAVASLIDELELEPHVDVTTLHVHRGGTMRSPDDVATHVTQVLGFLDEIRAVSEWSPSLLDVGGSLASPTVAGFDRRAYRLNRFLGADLLPPDPAGAITVGEASRAMAAMVHDWAAASGIDAPRVVMEPGRALTSPTQMLLTTVTDVKTDIDPPHGILDAGLNVAEAVTNEFHQLYSATAPTAPHHRSYRLAGPICTPADVLYNNWRLPDLEPGHVLAIMDAGAYLVPFATSFSFPQPAIVLVDGDDVTVTRAAETFDDLVARDHLLGGDR